MTNPSQQDNARFLVTGVQMPISLTENNIPAMRAKVTEVMALFPGTGMIVFSELAMHGPLEQRIAAEPEKDLEIFQDLAARHKVWIAPGSVYVRREGKVYNHAVVNGLDGGGNGKSLVADLCGKAVYQAGQAPQSFPVMLDLSLVRQSRGDRETEFDVYTPGRTSAFLDSRGPLEPMKRQHRQDPEVLKRRSRDRARPKGSLAPRFRIA